MSKSTFTTAEIGLFDGPILRRAAGQAFAKLNPRGLARNPVIFASYWYVPSGALCILNTPGASFTLFVVA